MRRGIVLPLSGGPSGGCLQDGMASRHDWTWPLAAWPDRRCQDGAGALGPLVRPRSSSPRRRHSTAGALLDGRPQPSHGGRARRPPVPIFEWTRQHSRATMRAMPPSALSRLGPWLSQKGP